MKVTTRTFGILIVAALCCGNADAVTFDHHIVASNGASVQVPQYPGSRGNNVSLNSSRAQASVHWILSSQRSRQRHWGGATHGRLIAVILRNLRRHNFGGHGGGPTNIAPVPEPEVYAMLALGFGVLLILTQRRRRFILQGA